MQSGGHLKFTSSSLKRVSSTATCAISSPAASIETPQAARHTASYVVCQPKHRWCSPILPTRVPGTGGGSPPCEPSLTPACWTANASSPPWAASFSSCSVQQTCSAVCAAAGSTREFYAVKRWQCPMVYIASMCFV